jgi:hypothetical protein
VAKKKKSRVPAPPRPVQAPKRRVEPRDPRRTRILFLAIAGAIVLAAAIVGIAMAVGGGGSGIGASGVDGPCQRATFPPMGRQHVNQLSKGFVYNSFPPSSGPHYPPGPKAPAVWGIYDTAADEVALVHNLEHGGVVVQYGDKVPQATIAQIATWYGDSPLGLLVAPLPPVDEVHAEPPANYQSKIFVTAWTHVMTCSAFDEGAFDRFLDDYRGPQGDAPEKFPLESLQPGGQ